MHIFTVMKRAALVSLLVAVACGGPTKEAPHGHLSTSEHHTEAERHDKIAEGHERAVQRNYESQGRGEIQCVDQPLAGQPTSGGERIPLIKPCWTREMDPANIAHKRAAARHRRLAAEHRSRAEMLARIERRNCRGMGVAELSHSPFWHREDVLRFEPIKRGNRLLGVRTVFKKVRGLSVQWMGRAVACHKARAAAIGYKTRYMPYCPLMLPHIETAVRETPEGIVVDITSKHGEMAAAALGRVQDGPAKLRGRR